MTKSYIKNWFGFQLTAEEMEDIPNPLSELMCHVTFKTIQAGVVIGTVGGALAAVSRRSTRNVIAIEDYIRKYGVDGGIMGACAGPALTVQAKQRKNIDNNGSYDRCYRLRQNRGQIRIDRSMDLGMLVGAIVSLMANKGLMYGAVMGCTCCVLGCILLNVTVFNKNLVATREN